MAKQSSIPHCECGHLLYNHEYDAYFSEYTACKQCECDLFIEKMGNNGR